MELNLESLDASVGSSCFLLTVRNSVFSITHLGQSSAFIHASGQRLNDILNNWLLVVYDAS